MYENDKKIQGFIGAREEYIEGIFVVDEMQSHGIGKKLLDYIKNKKVRLQLNVYQKNVRAMSFYQVSMIISIIRYGWKNMDLSESEE